MTPCRSCLQGVPGCSCPEPEALDAEWEAARSPQMAAEDLGEAFRRAREGNLQKWGLRPKGTSIEARRVA